MGKMTQGMKVLESLDKMVLGTQVRGRMVLGRRVLDRTVWGRGVWDRKDGLARVLGIWV